ncbi:MAG: hypothetical protein AAFX80_02235 [Cyanobacteria bacterium J06639_18]
MAETTITNNLRQTLEEFDHLKQHPEFDKIVSFLQGKQDITLIDAESSIVQAIALLETENVQV